MASEAGMSTYGIGREFSAAGWRDLLDQLLFEGLLREDPNDGRPLVGLGEADEVRAVYRGERRVSVRQMPAGAEATGRSGRARGKRHGGERLGVEGADGPLFEALRAWRRERAAEQHVPPYVIFHDVTLSAIARQRPADVDALAKISGVGVSKLKRYGEDVLRVVREN
jgi:ATP-dependent DNA helicase RecQ